MSQLLFASLQGDICKMPCSVPRPQLKWHWQNTAPAIVSCASLNLPVQHSKDIELGQIAPSEYGESMFVSGGLAAAAEVTNPINQFTFSQSLDKNKDRRRYFQFICMLLC